MKQKRPDIFTYHDYRMFLADMCGFLKSTVAGLNVARLAKESGLSKAYLSMVLSGERKLTESALQKLLPHLSLSHVEESYFKFLCELAHAKSQSAKALAIEEMQKLRSYQKNNPNESVVFRYLSRWYNVAIREMAALEDFQLDAKWIQARLKESVTLTEIEKSMEFLLENGFLVINPEGKVFPPNRRIECIDEIYKIAMVKFHEQVFSLAIANIPKLEKNQKILTAHTTALSLEGFNKIKLCIEETLEKIIDIAEKDTNPEVLFQFSLLGFSLTELNKKGSIYE